MSLFGRPGNELPSQVRMITVILILLLPALHPLLRTFAGDASHLLWWMHVLPVGLVSFWHGRAAAFGVLTLSAALAAGGESLFGQGYGLPADGETILSVTMALMGTNALVIASSLYARGVSGRYKVLFDSVRMAVIRVDSGGRTTDLNPAAEALLLEGGGPRRLRGTKLGNLLRLPGALDVWKSASAGWTGELEIQHTNGAHSIHAFVLAAEDPETGGGQVLVLDRSTEVFRNLELDRRSRLASLGEALAGTAHELNNPLATILAHAQMWGLDPVPSADEARDSFKVIEGQARRMRDLIRELLGFSREPSAGGAGENVGVLIQRLIRIQRVSLGRKVSLEFEAHWDGVIHGADKVEQILLNLISNAAHSVLETGGGTVTLTTQQHGDQVLIEVGDDGPGIPPELHEDLFEPFFTTKPEGEGTGLGLAISRRLARTLGGDLTLGRPEPRGAVFVLSLPLMSESAS